MLLAYLSLFASAFLAATVLPFYSEVVFVGLLQADYDPLTLIVVASVGNVLGAVVNWILGIYIQHFKDRPWFYFSPSQIERAQNWFQRYGYWTLLLAWAPIGGDALTLIAGIMRVRLSVFLILVSAGKAGRYVFLAWISSYI
ncbi:MAG: YqaA family protein [Gammaproteobacteria bacterium]